MKPTLLLARLGNLSSRGKIQQHQLVSKLVRYHSNGKGKYVAAIDQGTSSTRFMVFSSSGEVVSVHQEEHQQMSPRVGCSEHNPLEIWQKTQACISQAMQKANITASDIAAIGITNQRETTVVWNRKTGKPYHNAIVWNDLRTTGLCDQLAEVIDRLIALLLTPLSLSLTFAAIALQQGYGGKDRLRAKTGLPLAPYFSASKLVYLLDTVPNLRADAEAGEALFGNIDTWLIWNLTQGKVHATDVTNASRTLMMNLHTLQWDSEITTELNIPVQMLPTIKPSSGLFGHVTGTAGLEGVPIAGVLGDQQAALFGQSCFEVGDTKCTYGTNNPPSP